VLQCVRRTPCRRRYVLQCVASCCSLLQRVVVSQEAERRNTPGHKGCALQCVLQCVLQSVRRQRGGIPLSIKRPAGNTRLCAPCLWHCAALLLFFCVVDSFSLCCSVLQGVAGCCRVLQCVAVCVAVCVDSCDTSFWYKVCCSVLQCVDWCISVTRLVHMCVMTHWYVTHDSHDSFIPQ
jgi:hypothetical protein